jgi:ketosteroid isomerase-like protein
MSIEQQNKDLINKYYQALEQANSETIKEVLTAYFKNDCHWYGVYPFEEQSSPQAINSVFWQPFLESFKHLQRRQDIFLAGKNHNDGSNWVTSMGHFMAVFDKDWLGIPRSGKVIMIRYADFNCIEDGAIVRSAFFCDIIGVMEQVGINPLPQPTGHSFIYPGPKTHDGILSTDMDPLESDKTLSLINQMIDDFAQLNKTANDTYSPEILEKTWADNMTWYGPAGIGATYTIAKFQQQHSYPFRQGLKDKVFNGHICRFAEGNYGCFFGWPNLTNTPIGGFLGLPGGNVRADMRVVDIYRREGDKLVENWVIIDLPYWLKQQGLDILSRSEKINNPK